MPNHQQQPNTQQPQTTQAQKPQATQTSGSEPAISSQAAGQRPMTSQPPQGQRSQEIGALSDKATKDVEQAKTSAMERVESVRERAQTGITEQRSAVASRIGRFGNILHDASESLRSDDEFLAHWVDEAGQRVERVASYVGEADLGDVLEDVRDFARARPAWFIGGAFLAGLAIGRFLKSGAPQSGGSFGGSLERDYPEEDAVRVQQTSFVGGQSYPVGGEPYPGPDVPKVEP